jgi:BMFP domain-containing protein YqiC
MMKPNAWFEEFQKSISDLVAKSPAADIERNVKAFMGQAFNRMDLVTREEFDVQADLLKHASVRIEALEQQLHALETRVAALEHIE